MKRHYETLGLCPGATLDEVRQAYRDLVRVWHPDRFAGDYRLARISEEKLKSINEAYREVRAHIETHVPSCDADEARTPPSREDAEYLYEFYDYEYSPWIWTYKRIADAEEDARRRRSRSRRIVGAAALAVVAAVAAAVLLLERPALRGGAGSGGPVQAAAPPAPRPPANAALPPGGSAEAGPDVSAGGNAPAAPAADLPSDREETAAGPTGTAVTATAATAPGTDLPPGTAPFGRGIRGGTSRIGVVNGTRSGAVVVFLRREGDGVSMVRNFYLPPGRGYVATEVPPGTYILQAALGESWDADAGRFRIPLRYGTSAEFEVREEETAADGRGGILSRRRISSDLRLELERVLVRDISERAFHGR